MGMELQIMYIKKCTFKMSSVAFIGPQNFPKSLAAGASLHTLLGAYSTSSDPLAGSRTPTYKAAISKGMGGEGKGGRQNDLCPGHQKSSRRHCSE